MRDDIADSNPFDNEFEDLPDTLPIFPLDGVLLLPRGHLPLNIFEPRYISMVNDAMATNRLIGMIQPHKDKHLFEYGCAGRIVQFQETEDGRYLITLKGVSRFHVIDEMRTIKKYRMVHADWTSFRGDLKPSGPLGVDRSHLTALLKTYFEMNDISIDWKLVTVVNDEKLTTCLAMICPFSPSEKQALLEAPDCASRSKLLMSLLEMSVNKCEQRGSQH